MIGTKLAHYEVTSHLGTGGMGEVYQATDTKLGRSVAIKLLPEAFSHDSDRVARFEREARVLASLNHPNIAAIYGVEESHGRKFLVMELAPGETLADRLKRGPFPLDEALEVCRQVAEALQAAHAKDILHRDLKPANIQFTPEGRVKVLDFGLAKMMASDDQAVAMSHSPTVMSPVHTGGGVILGTAAYMSPEQAKGKLVDRRADIWAFGVVLHEMLTGRRLFDGETVSETIASVLKEEPVWDSVPVKVRRLLRSCLKKNPAERLHDIADWSLLLDDAAQAAPPAPRPVGWLWPSAAAFFLLAAGAVAYTHWSEQPLPLQIVRFQAAVPEQVSVVNVPAFAISPDGRYLAFLGVDTAGLRIWVRSMDSLDAHPLPDSDLANTGRPIFWSPDSRFIAFDASGKLRRIDIGGGPPQAIGDLPVASVGGSWNQDGVIILGSTNGLMRIPAGGGNVSPVTVLGNGEAAHAYPVFLPDGKHFLYVRATAPGVGSIYVGSLDAKPEEQDTSPLVQSGFNARYVPSSNGTSGQLLFVRQGSLLAQTFDSERLQLVGDPVQVADEVGTAGSFALFSASATGHLIYRTGPGQDLQLTWFDRQGKVLGTVGEPGRYNFLALSPDARRAVTSRIDPQSGNSDLWLTDLTNGASTRLTFDRATGVRSAAWSPDGSKIIFLSNRDGAPGLYQKATNGAGGDELLFKGEGLAVNQWSRDGRFVIFGMGDPKTGNDLWLMPIGGEQKPIGWNRAAFSETGGRISPDGRWAAYRSNESGANEVYVQPFSPTADSGTSASAGKWMVSRGSLGMARWRDDSKELYYLTTDARVMSVAVSTASTFQAGPPAFLFQVPAIFLRGAAFPGTLADVTADGKQFLFAMPVAQSGREEFTVVLNWLAALK
jgi:Tol biopolymer transport system component